MVSDFIRKRAPTLYAIIGVKLLKGSLLLGLAIPGLNILIVWYLFQNRARLFRHHPH